MFTSSLSSLVVAATTFGAANAFFKVACTLPIVQEFVDPILSPGVASQHLHSVHGGNNFSMNQTYTTLRESSCTSCEVTNDLSNYWVPTLYFKDPLNGTFTKVPNGGLLVYYENRGNGDTSNGGAGLTAFPPGFRMLSGNAAKRAQIYPIGQGSQDGVNLWLPGSAHVSYLSGLDNGVCDDAHPVYLMHLFYEVTWDLSSFRSQWVPQGYPWPFVYSNSDPTGFGWHGDFYNGWDQTVLQNAINNCNDPNNPGQAGGLASACPYLTVVDGGTAGECTIKNVEVTQPQGINGPLATLPGCNPLQYGPCDATLYPFGTSPCPATGPACAGTTTTATSASQTTSSLPTGTATSGTYLGCYVDSGSARTLASYTTTNNAMTNPLCVQTCSNMGYMFAGTGEPVATDVQDRLLFFAGLTTSI
ncbi:hypothetical protein FRB97_008023 [Tulasnella sp. 331]|nr:hypothetical protein FRB97_008023 [Tulasnella sp. 331]